jgi:hypothetical protein
MGRFTRAGAMFLTYIMALRRLSGLNGAAALEQRN